MPPSAPSGLGVGRSSALNVEGLSGLASKRGGDIDCDLLFF